MGGRTNGRANGRVGEGIRCEWAKKAREPDRTMDKESRMEDRYKDRENRTLPHFPLQIDR